ncbi:hypothetical protein FACS1894130_01440 [Spirochaetia bacterium]|nr:hypothetical protein FACS1894130_01440 [Spirochaetia bacterium]
MLTADERLIADELLTADVLLTAVSDGSLFPAQESVRNTERESAASGAVNGLEK